MPSSCCVYGCGNRFGRDKKSFFRIPCTPKRGHGKLFQLKWFRRFKWLRALRRLDLPNIESRVCEDHFIKGKPADLYDVHDPDWIPSKNLEYNNDISSSYTMLEQKLISQSEYLTFLFGDVKQESSYIKSEKLSDVEDSILTPPVEVICSRNTKNRNKTLTRKRAKSTARKSFAKKGVISGKPADLLDIENPDWVPSVKMGHPTNEKYPVKALSIKLGYSTARKSFSVKRKNNGDCEWSPFNKKSCSDKSQKAVFKSKRVHKKQTNDYVSPCIEYLSASKKSARQSSLKSNMQNKIVEQDSDISEDSIDERIDSPEQNISDEEFNSEDENINSSEEIASDGELSVLEKFSSVNKIHEDTNSSKENDTDDDDFSKNVDKNANTSSKKIQTYLTMIDLDKLSNGYKASIAEIQRLKAKLSSLTQDILHLNDVYC